MLKVKKSLVLAALNGGTLYSHSQNNPHVFSMQIRASKPDLFPVSSVISGSEGKKGRKNVSNFIEGIFFFIKK